MISYLEVLLAGARLEPRELDHALDKRGRFKACDGTLRAVGSKTGGVKLRAAIAEREELARRVITGGFPWLESHRGQCDVCGMPQEGFRSGICLLCRAAVQKEQKANDA